MCTYIYSQDTLCEVFVNLSCPYVATCRYTSSVNSLDLTESSAAAQQITPCPFDESSMTTFAIVNEECNPQNDLDFNGNGDELNISMSSCLKKLRNELCPSRPFPARNHTCHLSDQLVCMAELCHTVSELDADMADTTYFECHDNIIGVILQETDLAKREMELINNAMFYQFSSCVNHTNDTYYCLDTLVEGCFYGSSISTIECLEHLPSICQNLVGDSSEEECVYQLHQVFEDDVYRSCRKGNCVSVFFESEIRELLSNTCYVTKYVLKSESKYLLLKYISLGDLIE